MDLKKFIKSIKNKKIVINAILFISIYIIFIKI